MQLLIDIGNTSTTFGLKVKRNKYHCWRIDTKKLISEKILKSNIIKNLKKGKVKLKNIDCIAVCSVVPTINKKLKLVLRKIFQRNIAYLIGNEIKSVIRNKYKYPSQVGKDRLVNALAVLKYYKVPAIIVDFGTAITIDVVSKKGEYLGGVIVPGIGLSLNSLNESTALLPLLNPERPKSVLGKDTKSSILSGIFYGYSFLVDGIVTELKMQLKFKPIVIATGGNLNIMKSLCDKIDKFDPFLTVKGIEIAYKLLKNKA